MKTTQVSKGLHDINEKGPVNMCASCYSMLVNKHHQPLNLLANFQYYGHNELPEPVKDVFAKVSMFDLMLVSWARATRLMHLFLDPDV